MSKKDTCTFNNTAENRAVLLSLCDPRSNERVFSRSMAKAMYRHMRDTENVSQWQMRSDVLLPANKLLYFEPAGADTTPALVLKGIDAEALEKHLRAMSAELYARQVKAFKYCIKQAPGDDVIPQKIIPESMRENNAMLLAIAANVQGRPVYSTDGEVYVSAHSETPTFGVAVHNELNSYLRNMFDPNSVVKIDLDKVDGAKLCAMFDRPIKYVPQQTFTEFGNLVGMQAYGRIKPTEDFVDISEGVYYRARAVVTLTVSDSLLKYCI